MNIHILLLHIIIVSFLVNNTIQLYKIYNKNGKYKEYIIYKNVKKNIKYINKKIKNKKTKNLKEIIKENGINYYTLIESNYFSMFVFDDEYNYVDFNNKHKEGMSKWLNINISPKDNIIDIFMQFKDCSGFEYIGEFKNNVDKALSGESFVISKKIDIQGTELYFLLEFIPKVNINNEVNNVLIILLDITEDVRSHKKIIQGKNSIEKLYTEKSQYAEYISHEIKTSINCIIGLSDILLQIEENRKSYNYLNSINNSGKHLLNIINDVLDVTKLESGRLELNKQIFNFNDMIIMLDDIFHSQKKQTGIFIKFKMDPRIPEFLIGDMLRVNQIIINLVSNAYKYMDEGFVQINIKLEEKANYICGKCYIRLRFNIIDSGIGIPEEHISSIFQKYVQIVKSNKKEETIGIGLGLTISKQLIEIMGGSISVTSKVNEGTNFAFEIPFQAIEKNVEKKLFPLHIEDKDINILVADDNEVNQIIIQSFINAQGWKSYIVENGKQVIDEVYKNKYDLILMDFHMPIMNGIEAAKEIRKDINLKNIPIIALTAGGFEEYRENSEWFSAYISKPTNEIDLKFVLKKQLRFSLSKNKKQNLCKDELHKFESLEKMIGGNKDIVIELAEKIIGMFSQMELERIRKMINEKNIIELEELIHKLKGAILNFQLTELVKIMDNLIENVKLKNIERVENDFFEISEEISKFKKSVKLYSIDSVKNK